MAKYVLDSILADCGSWVALLRDSQPHSALTSGQRHNAMCLAFAWRECARWLSDAQVDKADVASQYAISIDNIPVILRFP